MKLCDRCKQPTKRRIKGITALGKFPLGYVPPPMIEYDTVLWIDVEHKNRIMVIRYDYPHVEEFL